MNKDENVNILFYFSCRFKIETNLDIIYEELKYLFEIEHVPKDLTEWSQLCSMNQGETKFEPTKMTVFRALDFSPKNEKQYYALSRFQLGAKTDRILDELEKIFGFDSNESTNLQSWIVNDFKNPFINMTREEQDKFISVSDHCENEVISFQQPSINEPLEKQIRISMNHIHRLEEKISKIKQGHKTAVDYAKFYLKKLEDFQNNFKKYQYKYEQEYGQLWHKNESQSQELQSLKTEQKERSERDFEILNSSYSLPADRMKGYFEEMQQKHRLEIIDLESKLNESKNKMQQLEFASQINSVIQSNELDKALESNSELAAQIEKLKEEMKKLNCQLTKSNDVNEASKMEIAILQATISELNETNKKNGLKQNETLESYRTQILENKNLENQLSLANENINRKNEDLEALQIKLDELTNELRSVRGENKNALSRNTQLELELKETTAQVTNLKNDNQTLLSRVNSIEENCKQVQTKLDNEMKKNEKLEVCSSQINASNMALETKINELKKEYANKTQKQKTKFGRLLNELNAANESNLVLKANDEEQKEHLNELSDRLAKSNSLNEKQLNEVNEARTKTTSLQNTIDELNESNRKLKIECNDISQCYKTQIEAKILIEKEVEFAVEETKCKANQINELEKKLEDSLKDKASYLDNLLEVSAERDEISISLQQSKKEIERYEKEITKLNALLKENKDEPNKLKQEINQANQMRLSLQAHLVEMTSQKVKAEELVTDLNSQIENVNQDKVNLEKEINCLKDKFSVLDEHYELKIKESQKALQLKDLEFVNLNDSLEQLRTQIENSNNLIASLNLENADLKKKLAFEIRKVENLDSILLEQTHLIVSQNKDLNRVANSMTDFVLKTTKRKLDEFDAKEEYKVNELKQRKLE